MSKSKKGLHSAVAHIVLIVPPIMFGKKESEEE
jgi:hypothetical protein